MVLLRFINAGMNSSAGSGFCRSYPLMNEQPGFHDRRPNPDPDPGPMPPEPDPFPSPQPPLPPPEPSPVPPTRPPIPQL